MSLPPPINDPPAIIVPPAMIVPPAIVIPPSADIPQQLAAATAAWKKMRRLASYASFDGWTLTVLGALSLICGGYSSADGLIISFGLLGTGIFEILTVSQLRRLKASAVTQLAYNQLVLVAAVIVYALIKIFQTRRGGGMSSELDDALTQLGASTSETQAKVSNAIAMGYGALLMFTIVVQGGTALYYFSRRKHLLRYLADTPQWIQQMQRERGEVSL